MYLSENGKQVPVVFSSGMEKATGSDVKESFASGDTAVGENKMWLYLALIVAIIAVIVTGYLLYNHDKKQSNKVGYQLY